MSVPNFVVEFVISSEEAPQKRVDSNKGPGGVNG